jgi:hypothetical protein
MLANEGVWMRRRQDLRAQRAALLRQLNLAPEDPGITSQLKVIDATIAECAKNIERSHPPAGEPSAAKS